MLWVLISYELHRTRTYSNQNTSTTNINNA